MSKKNLRQKLAEAEEKTRLLYEELEETNKGVNALNLELRQQVKNLLEELKETNKGMNMLNLELEERTKRLKAAQNQLIRQEKLAILGKLAGGVAHELRNPLGAIKNAIYFLHMILEKPEPEVREIFEILDKEITTSVRIIESLIDFAHLKTPIQQKSDINNIIQEVMSQFSMPQNVELLTLLEKRLPLIVSDPKQLGQAFTNIILNALQAMPEGGKLTIKTEVVSPEWVTISIADTGVGISKENLKKVFEPLFTTKAKGIGFGLAITKIMVEKNSGTIELKSKIGKGTIFTAKLPIDGKEGR